LVALLLTNASATKVPEVMLTQTFRFFWNAGNFLVQPRAEPSDAVEFDFK
jgi:hypothetical protein